MEAEKNEEKNQLTRPEEIYRAIQRLIRYAQNVKIRFDGNNEAFNSAITKVDLKNKAFAFDKLVPDAGNDMIRQGKHFTIEADFRGISVKFSSGERLKYKQETGEYIASFPDSMLYLQRRNAYRAMIPRTYQVLMVLRSSEDQQVVIKGRLQDISASGFKAYFKGNVSWELMRIKNFDESTLHVGNESMDCGIDARHAVFNEEKDLTFCGFSFQPLSGMKQRYVEKLVNQLQYEERRKEEAQAEKNKQEVAQLPGE